MASLSNINGIFDVHSTGAVQFNGNHGASGQILKSNGNAAPTWVAASTVIGGPYLPLTGGTLSGATATATGISFTVGGALTGTSATFSGNVTGPRFIGTSDRTEAVDSNDTRSTNPDPEDIGKGVYFDFKSNSTNGLSDGGGYNGMMLWRSYGGGSDLSGGQPIRLAYTANGNLWRQMGTGATSWGSWNKFAICTGTSSQYIRGDGSIATFPTISTGTVTSVATGSGLTGGTITTTGTLSLDRPNSALGAVLATYGTTAGSAGRIRCTAPFNTNTGKMFSIEITLYSSYTQHNYVVSAYMYSSTNQWYAPKAIYTTNGTATPDIYVGRDASGKAYISIANASYTGVLVHNMTRGYQTSLADTYDPWTIAVNSGNENSVSVATSQVWTTANHTPGNYLPLAGGTMSGNIAMGGASVTGAQDFNGAQFYAAGWFRNSTNNTGLYNSSQGNHFACNGGYWDVGYAGTNGIRLRNGHNGTIMGYLYGETSGQFGLLDKDGQWTLRTDGATETELRANNVIALKVNSSGNTHVIGNLTIGNSTSSDLYFTDTNETTRRMHCNSNRLGFLNSSNNWSAYSENNGNWIMSAAATVSSTLTANGDIQVNGEIRLKDRITLPASGLSSVSGRPGYAIYQEGGAWAHPYPDLCIAMHTGIKLGANASYNGIRFYDDYTMATQVMAVNDSSSPIGAGHVYVNNVLQAGSSLRAPIFYDTNTNYYGDFASTSVLNALQFNYTQHGSANNIRMGNSTTMNAISSGNNNAAFGVEALGNCSTGSRNFAYGYASLFSLSSGGSNIAMGDATGYNVTSGSNNLLFGQNAGRTGYQSPYQSIAGVTSGSNQIHMGNESHSTARIQISWTVNSDSRDKTDVTPIDVGLDFVKDLNPVTFRWDKRSDYKDRTPTGENKLEELTLGFLAQEVEEVEKSYGYDVANKTNLVVDRDVEQDHFGITYEKMIPILTKAIQELEARVKELENK